MDRAIHSTAQLSKIPTVSYPLGQNASLSSHLKMVIDNNNSVFKTKLEQTNADIANVQTSLTKQLNRSTSVSGVDPTDLVSIVQNTGAGNVNQNSWSKSPFNKMNSLLNSSQGDLGGQHASGGMRLIAGTVGQKKVSLLEKG